MSEVWLRVELRRPAGCPDSEKLSLFTRVKAVMYRTALVPLLLLAACGAQQEPPSAQGVAPPNQRTRADPRLGDLRKLEPNLRRAFEAEPGDFGPLRTPGSNDWLTIHPEPSQSVGNFWLSSPNQPTAGERDTIYLLPLGAAHDEDAAGPDLEALRSYAGDFFGLPVKLLPAVALSEIEVTSSSSSPSMIEAASG